MVLFPRLPIATEAGVRGCAIASGSHEPSDSGDRFSHKFRTMALYTDGIGSRVKTLPQTHRFAAYMANRPMLPPTSITVSPEPSVIPLRT